MQLFSDGKLTDRRMPRGDGEQAPEKSAVGGERLAETPEEFHQTQAFIQDLDKQFTRLREAFHTHRAHIVRAKGTLSELQTLLFPARRRWWRRWLPW